MERKVNNFAVILALIVLYIGQTCTQPIQNEPVEIATESIVAANDESTTTAPTTTAPVEAPRAVEYFAVNPQLVADDVFVTVPEQVQEQEHMRTARHIGIGGIGGGFVGGFAGGAVASPIYSVPLVQTVPVVTTVPVVSTITTYPSYAIGYGYGYGGYSPIGFGGVGYGKIHSSYTVKGFGVGGGFIG